MIRTSNIESVMIDPPAREWGDLIAKRLRDRETEELLGRPVDDWVALSRREIGEELSGVEFVIGTGHQAGFWHCGILAKYCAAEAAAVALSRCFSGEGGVLELVVDQDVNDPFRIRSPIRKKKLEVLSVKFAGINGRKIGGRVPVEKRPPIHVDTNLSRFINGMVEPESAREGLHAIAEVLDEAGGVGNAAEQAALANYLLRQRLMGVADVRREITFASTLTKMSIWERLIALMRGDPKGCSESYNGAVLKFPDSGMALLDVDGDDIELPLWKIDGETGERQRVFHGDLDDEDVVVRPRALLMTGLVRLVLVDLFVHGLGGQNYDRVTEQWFYDWLGVKLSPHTSVSADAYVDFGLARVDEKAVSEARWQLHHLKYNIDRVVEGGEELTARKRVLVERINELPRRSAERYAVYLELQAINEALGRQYHGLLDEARTEIHRRERALGDRAVIGDRSWAFALHGRETLLALREGITRLFVGVEEGVACCCGGVGLMGG